MVRKVLAGNIENVRATYALGVLRILACQPVVSVLGLWGFEFGVSGLSGVIVTGNILGLYLDEWKTKRKLLFRV